MIRPGFADADFTTGFILDDYTRARKNQRPAFRRARKTHAEAIQLHI